MHVLVTGGAGRLGIHVCKRFLKEGFQIRVLDQDTAANRRRAKAVKKEAHILWGDVRRAECVK